MKLLALLLGVIATGLVLLIINHNSGETFGIKNDAFSSLVYLAPIAILMASGILASRNNLLQSVKQLGIWALIALGLVTVYIYKNDAEIAFARIRAALLPGHPVVLTTVDGNSEVVIAKNRNGHFAVEVSANNEDIDMLVDTGATRIALTYEDAQKIGLFPAKLSFTHKVMTANGEASAAIARIRQLAIGPIVRRNVSVTIASPGKLDQSLLGMNFLSTLSGVRFEPDEMRLTD